MLPRALRRSLVALAAFTRPVYTQNNASQEPCAQLSSLATNNATFFPAHVALSCLRSVPLAKAGDLIQLQGLRAFLEFQSDLEYLKDPTIGRIYPGADILAGLDKLTSLLEDDAYDNEYDFQTDVSKVFFSAYDGHLAYVPDITAVFAFGRLHTEESDDSGVPSYFSLISITTGDNVSPEVYAYSDEAALCSPEDFDYIPSPVVQINGDDILSWLNSYASQNGRSQDPDANYNQLFVDVPALLYQGVETNYFALSRYYQGDNTVLRFANETTRDVITRAQLLSNATLEGLTDGASFFERFCNKNLTETILAQASSSSSQTILNETQVPFEPVSTEGLPPPHPAYPSPIAISSDNSVAGYLSESISDLAILAIPSFTTSSPIGFENVVRQLLATASENNRTKLVIDLRGNGGGTIFLAYDLFRQLFPTVEPYGAGNYRAGELHNFTGRVVSDNIEQLGSAYPELVNTGIDGVILNSFDYREPLTADGEQFSSWADFFGPRGNDVEEFTSLNRFNLTDISATTVPILGYADNSEPQPQVFSSEDIVLLHDGACASTCALFSELMASQKSTSVTVGGRPQNGPMQGVGSVKGSQVQGMFTLYSIISAVITAAPIADQLEFVTKFGIDFVQATTQALSRAAPGGAVIVQASLNFRNNIREGDDSVTPLQHIYEAADCRFFYTPEMYASQAAVWERAYNSAWRDMECIEGSTEHPSSVSGGSDVTAGPPETASIFFGGNNTISLGEQLASALLVNSTSGNSTDTGPGAGSTAGNNGTEGDQGSGDSKGGSTYVSIPTVFAAFMALGSIMLSTC
ncbi:hypothetical protein E4T43_03732 [Aureobasidium subglaciale]|nr:hypothetical protein E4T43_03732 [Aureobasidium subglaciale]